MAVPKYLSGAIRVKDFDSSKICNTLRKYHTAKSFLLTYFGRHSLRGGCAGGHSNNHIPSCRRPSLAILRPGDFQRQPLPVPPPEAVYVRTAHPCEILLQHAEPGLKLTISLPALVRKRHRVDDVTDDFVRGTGSSMSEPSEQVL